MIVDRHASWTCRCGRQIVRRSTTKVITAARSHLRRRHGTDRLRLAVEWVPKTEPARG